MASTIALKHSVVGICAALAGCVSSENGAAPAESSPTPATSATDEAPGAGPPTSPSPEPGPCRTAQPRGAGWTVDFETRVLSDQFVSEAAAVGDLNGDGCLDLVAGPWWFAGPDFERSFRLSADGSFTKDEYSTFFLTFLDDLDTDGDLDVIAIAGPGGVTGNGELNARWYENTLPAPGDWPVHLLSESLVSNESPVYADLVADARAELVFMTDQQLGFAARGAAPTDPWSFTPVSARQFSTPYVHGLGVGDIDGDGLSDIIEATGWWQQPAGDLRSLWQHHPVDFAAGGRGGAQMLVTDVDGDGDADVVASANAHGYGLYWFEQLGLDDFVAHEVLPQLPAPDSFSQQHALAWADMNGDGLLDVVTGKRYYAHPSASPDPGTDDPAVVYWFELSRTDPVGFLPHLVHTDSGVGCNFAIADVNADGRSDIFTANKRGVHLHTQR